jgi:hypothetical protein
MESLTIAPGELVTLLQEAWEAHDFRIPRMFGEASVPLARTSEDQKSATDNPLWEIVRWFPTERDWRGGLLRPDLAPLFPDEAWTRRLLDVGCTRGILCRTYAYSIPSPGDLLWMERVLDGRAVVETGAGSGYWAWQLGQVNIDVVAYDPHPVGENSYCAAGPYTGVLRGDSSAARLHPDRALLLVWPPYDKPVATQALSAYEGDLLLYAGEGFGGCTGNDEFHELLEEWEEFSVSGNHVTYGGIHCKLAAYRRR